MFKLLAHISGNRTKQEAITESVDCPPSEYRGSQVVNNKYYVLTRATTSQGDVKMIEILICEINVSGFLFLKDEGVEPVSPSEKSYQVPFRHAGVEIGTCTVKIRTEKGLVKEFSITELSVIEPEI